MVTHRQRSELSSTELNNKSLTTPSVLIELRRTGTVWVIVTIAWLGTMLLIARQPPFQSYNTWTSTWAEGAGWITNVSLVLGPVIGAVAAWHGGRESRRRILELVASTARPASHRLLAQWAAVTTGAVGGYIVYAAVVAAAIIPAVGYYGGLWFGAWWLIALGWITCASIGFAVGRLIPGRLVAPLFGVCLYVASALPSYTNARWIQLMPVGHLPSFGGHRLVGGVVPLASVWLLAVTATSLTLACAHRRKWSLIPGVVAAISALTLTTIGNSSDGYQGSSWAQVDPAAVRQACTIDGGLKVCVRTEHVGLLPEVTQIFRDALSNSKTLVPLSGAVEVGSQELTPTDVVVIPNLDGRYRAFRDGIDDPAQVVSSALENFLAPECSESTDIDAFYGDERFLRANMVAYSILADMSVEELGGDQDAVSLRESSLSTSLASKEWMSLYLMAAKSCDISTVNDLGTP